MVSDIKTINEYYRALVEKDSQYLGVFYAGVKTTNIFCIATCSARKPKMQNVDFFHNLSEVLQYGFRPCKVCKPTQNIGEPPTEVRQVMTVLSENPHHKVRDQDLKKMGIAPEKIRRWFKSHFDMTFQAYQRMLRINSAYEKLKNGHPVTASAFDSGYESLSGFGYSFKNLLKTSPENARKLNLIRIQRISTPLGPMYAGATDKGLCLLEFTDRRMLETELRDLTRLLRAEIIVGENKPLEVVKRQLKEYFQGERTAFNLPLDTPGTDFQQKVWRQLMEVGFGETVSYQQMAHAMGRPSAVRAVANANGHNRVAIIIPCHRVIGANGHLTGYGGGLPRKKWLLDHEKQAVMQS